VRQIGMPCNSGKLYPQSCVWKEVGSKEIWGKKKLPVRVGGAKEKKNREELHHKGEWRGG